MCPHRKAGRHRPASGHPSSAEQGNLGPDFGLSTLYFNNLTGSPEPSIFVFSNLPGSPKQVRFVFSNLTGSFVAFLHRIFLRAENGLICLLYIPDGRKTPDTDGFPRNLVVSSEANILPRRDGRPAITIRPCSQRSSLHLTIAQRLFILSDARHRSRSPSKPAYGQGSPRKSHAAQSRGMAFQGHAGLRVSTRGLEECV